MAPDFCIEKSMTLPSKLLPPTGLLVAVLAVMVAVIATTALIILPGHDPFGLVSNPPEGAKPPGIGGPFTLIAADGRKVTEKDLVGEPTLLFFGYTHCPDFCPTTLADMTAAFKAMGEEAKIRGIFVTLDPARDTPEVLRDYMMNFDPRILGLTGTKEEVGAMAKAYRVYSRQVPGAKDDYTLDHTAIVYLLDRSGRFVNAFNLQREPEAAARELEAYTESF